MNFVTYMAKGVDDFTIDIWDGTVWAHTNYNAVPKALKFTFTLYDSKGILKNGRQFTHIIYIGE